MEKPHSWLSESLAVKDGRIEQSRASGMIDNARDGYVNAFVGGNLDAFGYFLFNP